MKKLILSAWALLASSTMFAQKTFINDANAEQRSVGSFNGIQVSGAINLYLNQAEKPAVAVSASDAAYRDRIKTVVENGVLKIWFDNKGFKWKSGDKKMKAYVAFSTLNKLNAAGASDVYVEGAINGDELTITLSGASDFKGSVQLNKLSIDQSGASDATISGKVGTVSAEASGASDLKGYGLETESCTARASGASDIKITVKKELSATASGASSINYKGEGVIKEVKSSGASNVNKKS